MAKVMYAPHIALTGPLKGHMIGTPLCSKHNGQKVHHDYSEEFRNQRETVVVEDYTDGGAGRTSYKVKGLTIWDTKPWTIVKVAGKWLIVPLIFGSLMSSGLNAPSLGGAISIFYFIWMIATKVGQYLWTRIQYNIKELGK